MSYHHTLYLWLVFFCSAFRNLVIYNLFIYANKNYKKLVECVHVERYFPIISNPIMPMSRDGNGNTKSKFSNTEMENMLILSHNLEIYN